MPKINYDFTQKKLSKLKKFSTTKNKNISNSKKNNESKSEKQSISDENNTNNQQSISDQKNNNNQQNLTDTSTLDNLSSEIDTKSLSNTSSDSESDTDSDSDTDTNFIATGIHNYKGNCWINSLLQMLFNIDDFTNKIIDINVDDPTILDKLNKTPDSSAAKLVFYIIKVIKNTYT